MYHTFTHHGRDVNFVSFGSLDGGDGRGGNTIKKSKQLPVCSV